MAEDDTTRRPKRRCARKQSVVPSAVHYVGYVEADETPEMIMKKFEELERVMATSTAERPAEAGPSSASTELEGEFQRFSFSSPAFLSFKVSHQACSLKWPFS